MQKPKTRVPFLYIISLAIFISLFASAAQARIPLAIRGAVIVHLKPDAGVLTIRIEKRDLNIYEGEDILHARLFEPDRTPVAAATIPDDGNVLKTGASEKIQEEELSVKVTKPGIYRLHITPRNGDQVFGFETNCKRYVIEGGIFLNDYSLSCDVFFAPPGGEFKITAEAMHEPGQQKLPLYDDKGKIVHTFDLIKPGDQVEYTVTAEPPPSGKLWHFKVAQQDVRIRIDGVLYWTNSSDSYFDVGKAKWMLTPYRARIYLLPGESAELGFTLRNSSDAPGKLALSAQPPERMELRILSPQSPVELAAGRTTDVRVEAKVPRDVKVGESLGGYISAAYADDPDTVVSSAIQVEVKESSMSEFLNMPIVLRPYQHENEQFGYMPPYPCNPPFFDLSNRPYIRTRTADMNWTSGLQTPVDDKWIEKSFIPAIKAKYPDFRYTLRAAGWQGTKIAFDKDNHAYTLLRIMLNDRSQRSLLLYSPDNFDTFQIYELPDGTPDIEQFTGHNVLPDPPPIVIYKGTASHPARWASINDLKILLPQKKNGKLVLGEPVLVSDRCIGPCQHSGNPSPTATRDGRTHIVWGEVDDSGASGVPTYAATYFHDTGKVGPKVLLAYAPPVNDVHNAPGICMDSEGYLHAITGSHGQPFKYVRSLKPNDASEWTEPEDVLTGGSLDRKTGKSSGRQTYLALLCDSKDTLHIAFRQWRMGIDEYFDGDLYAALSYQRKKKGQKWEDGRPLVVPPLPSYSIYYHKLTIDRHDRLYLSYSYYTSDTTYQEDLPGQYNNRAVITSPDGGENWKLAETDDFLYR